MAPKEPTEGERRIAEILIGKFVKAVMKPTAKTKGTLEDDELTDWITPLLSDHYITEDFAEELHFSYPAVHPLPPTPLKGLTGASSPVERSFIYLDVGAWIGSKNKPWGKDKSKPGRYLKRDFGIICGRLVALCTYTYAHAGEHCELWKKNEKNDEEPWKSVAKLIAALSKAAEDEQLRGDAPLGSVIVREAMLASATNPVWPADTKDYVIHLLLGDMHIPVLDEEIQTYGPLLQREFDTAYQASGPPLQLEANKDKDPGKWFPARVRRLGRLDIRRIESIVKTLVKDDEATMLRNFVRFLQKARTMSAAEWDQWVQDNPHYAAGGVGGVAALPVVAAGVIAASPVGAALALGPDGALPLTSDPQGLKKGEMSKTDAKLWYEYYQVGKNGKPADIFEDAGDHVLHLALRLKSYMDRRAKEDLPVKFVQLGDMLDFWVGFTCHFVSSSDPDHAVPGFDRQGEEMLKYWTKNLFGETKQGQRIAEALGELKDAKIDQVFLYGNHDNYLGANPSLKYPFKGHSKTLEKRAAQYGKEFGLFIEHGHQWEPSNADNASSLGPIGTAVIGTPSPIGLVVTQPAFIKPETIRAFEGVAAGLVARFKGSKGQRLDQIIGAGCRFVEKSGGFYCYAMGHTHVACLCKVVLLDEKTRLKTAKVSVKAPARRMYFAVDQQEFTGIKFVPRMDVVNVMWKKVPRLLGSWIALVDHLARPRIGIAGIPKQLVAKQRVGKRPVGTDSQSADGGEVFVNVPPGVYQARYYATEPDEEPFLTSHNAIGVIGLSIEDDPSLPPGAVFPFDQTKNAPTRPIYLRWAFAPGAFDAQNAWFAFYRPDEHPEETTDYAGRQHLHGMRLFSKIMGTHPHWGRWNLLPALQEINPNYAREGIFQVYAFNGLRSPKAMAIASFTLTKVTKRG